MISVTEKSPACSGDLIVGVAKIGSTSSLSIRDVPPVNVAVKPLKKKITKKGNERWRTEDEINITNWKSG